MPLNRLNVRETDYPQTEDALPMVTKLQYSERFDKAMRYIFGKTMICRNLEVASVLARTTGLDCVTLDGDQVSSKGSNLLNLAHLSSIINCNVFILFRFTHGWLRQHLPMPFGSLQNTIYSQCPSDGERERISRLQDQIATSRK